MLVIDFLVHHWVLASLFVAALGWMLFEEAQVQGGGGVRQSPQRVVELINHEQAVVVDIRDAAAFAEGHITGSVNILLSHFERNINKLEKHKNKTIILVCSTGHQSLLVEKKLKKHGFTSTGLFILSGGLNAWKQAGLPLIKNKNKIKK